MDPGRAVEQIVHDLALQGDEGVSLNEFWELAQSIVGQPLDSVFRSAIWRWVTADRRVLVSDRDDVSDDDIDSPKLAETASSAVIRTIEEYQWLAITGQPKADSQIGAMAFKLLCAVSRSRAAGMSAIELNRATGQDPRSIHGRIAQLADLGLVARYPVVQNKAHTHLVVYKQYIDAYTSTASSASNHIDKFQLLKSILDWCKSGPNHMRLRQDLFLQLQFDKLHRGAPLLNFLLKKGEKDGNLVCLNVFESERPDSLYRCVKFLKDLDASSRDDDDEEELGEDEDFLDAQGYQPDVNKLVVAAEAPEPNRPLVNLFYPLEHQIYDLIHASGANGLPAMSLYNQLVGQAYQKPLGRLLDVLLAADAKKKPTPAYRQHLGFARGIDFVARMKFYRYFTQITFAQFQKRAADPEWGALPPPTDPGASSLQALSNKEASALAGSSSVVETESGDLVAQFHGDKMLPGSRVVVAAAAPAAAPGKRRGRPPKNAPKPLPVETPQPTPEPAELFPIAERQWRGGTPTAPETRPARILRPVDRVELEPETATPDPAPAPVQVSPSPSLSLAAAKREADILAIMAAEGGATLGGAIMCKKLELRDKSDSAIDRKTLDKAIAHLVTTHKVKQLFVTAPLRGIFVTRYLIYDPALSDEDPPVQTLKQSLSEMIQNPPVPATPVRAPPVVEGDISVLSTTPGAPRRFRVLASDVKKPKKGRKYGPRANEIVEGLVNDLEPRDASPTPARAPGSAQKRQEKKLSAAKKRKRPADEKEDTRGLPIDAERLYRAIVISRSMYSRGASIDWDMVVADIPGLSASRARKRWPTIRDQYGGTKALAKATERWEQVFLAAYAKGEIKYDDPEAENFSLQPYIDFWQHQPEASLFGGVKRLTSRTDFEERFGKIRAQPVGNPLEGVFTLPSMVRVEELLANTAFSTRALAGSTRDFVEFTPSEQLVRAVIASDDADLPPERAAELLGELGEDVVSVATEALVAAKVIHYILRDTTKVQPGRNYQLSERVVGALSTKLEPTFLADAWDSLHSLPASYAVPSTVEDSTMAVLLDLASTEQIHLRRVNLSTGRLISDYRSRMIEKQKLDFEVVVETTRAFRRPPRLYSTPPLAKEPGVSYLWQFSDAAFRLVLQRVLLLIVMRPYISLTLIAANLRTALRLDETAAIVTWLQETGRVDETPAGFVANGFWFC